MENETYGIRFIPTTANTLTTQEARQKLEQQGFEETSDAVCDALCFAVTRQGFIVQAQIETQGDPQFVHSVFVSVDVKWLIKRWVPEVADILKTATCSLLDDTTPLLTTVIHADGTRVPLMVGCADMGAQFEQEIYQQKPVWQGLLVRQALTREEIIQNMKDFPLREADLIAAIRESKDVRGVENASLGGLRPDVLLTVQL